MHTDFTKLDKEQITILDFSELDRLESIIKLDSLIGFLKGSAVKHIDLGTCGSEDMGFLSPIFNRENDLTVHSFAAKVTEIDSHDYQDYHNFIKVNPNIHALYLNGAYEGIDNIFARTEFFKLHELANSNLFSYKENIQKALTSRNLDMLSQLGILDHEQFIKDYAEDTFTESVAKSASNGWNYFFGSSKGTKATESTDAAAEAAVESPSLEELTEVEAAKSPSPEDLTEVAAAESPSLEELLLQLQNIPEESSEDGGDSDWTSYSSSNEVQTLGSDSDSDSDSETTDEL